MTVRTATCTRDACGQGNAQECTQPLPRTIIVSVCRTSVMCRELLPPNLIFLCSVPGGDAVARHAGARAGRAPMQKTHRRSEAGPVVCSVRLLPSPLDGMSGRLSLAAAARAASEGRVRGRCRGAAAQAAGLAVHGVAAGGCGMWEVLHGGAQGPVCRVPVEAGALWGRQGSSSSRGMLVQVISGARCVVVGQGQGVVVGQGQGMWDYPGPETKQYGCGM